MIVHAKACRGAAQNYLGFMYEHGQGVALDDAQAAQWYRKAEQGNPCARRNLAAMGAQRPATCS